jgi:deoxyribonuclease V
METNDRMQRAIRVQCMLRDSGSKARRLRIHEVTCIGGADAAYRGDRVAGAVAITSFQGNECIDEVVSITRTCFPYLPGLFAFREAPSLLMACRNLRFRPDVIICNGHGYAHPRRFGLASHIGLLLKIPSIGVANRLLIGDTEPAGPCRGDRSPVVHQGEVIGMALRTMENRRQVYVSAGYATDLQTAVELALQSTKWHRFPEALYLADRLSKKAIAEAFKGKP